MTCPQIDLSCAQCNSWPVVSNNADITALNIGINTMGLIGITNVVLSRYLLSLIQRTYTIENRLPLLKFSFALGIINSIYMSVGGYISDTLRKKTSEKMSDISTRVAGIWQNLLFVFAFIFKRAHKNDIACDFMITSYLLGFGNSIYSSIYAAFHNIKMLFA